MVFMNCPNCRTKMEYMRELARKNKPSHHWCKRCGIEWVIEKKRVRELVSIRN